MVGYKMFVFRSQSFGDPTHVVMARTETEARFMVKRAGGRIREEASKDETSFLHPHLVLKLDPGTVYTTWGD